MEALHYYIARLISDSRVKSVHLALSIALCNHWLLNRFQPQPTSRRRLMTASRIRSKTTYHKAMKELQRFGYIRYRPSFHPVRASSIEIRMERINHPNGEKQVDI